MNPRGADLEFQIKLGLSIFQYLNRIKSNGKQTLRFFGTEMVLVVS